MIFWLTIVEIWWFFLTKEVSATAILPHTLQRKRRFLNQIRVL
ncbi:hypothetical protein HMPREF1149_1658 [Streptococcus sp. BS35b]|nr:hypothetical protein HMPREF1149_1658 [Streptococcus sp. BS35b]ETS88301.1 hypothetical protein HMPREF1513_0727 [Streptococcus sp. BS29a]EUB29598.1 hypothetical protein HMPREF1515_0312 [Streptococcus sp. BS21]